MNTISGAYPLFFFGFLALFVSPGCNGADSSDQSSQAVSNDTIQPPATTMFVGTYTRKEPHVDGKGEGIYHLQVSPGTGVLAERGVVRDTNPSFLAFSPDENFLYAVNEVTSEVAAAGWVTAYRFDPDTGLPEKINQQSSEGWAPCHLTVDHSGRYVLVANYLGGVVAVLPVAEDGSLRPASDIVKLEGSGPHPEQNASHPHMVYLSADNRFVYAPDKGTDRVNIFRLDLEAGKLIPNTPAFAAVQPGAGPRHMTIHPNGRFTYLINELDATVNVFLRDSTSGSLEEIQRIGTLPADYDQPGNYCADLHLSPDGHFLYGSNRGHDSIVIYAVDAQSGRLSLVGHEPTRGEFPRNFTISPDGRFIYVANQNSDNITLFERDADTGKMTYLREFRVPSPVCLKMP